MLVEDDATVRELARETLITQGYSVYEVGNGQEAIDFLEKSPAKIDLLVSDTIMPKMGGTELFRRLAAARPDLKILLMSGYSSEECSPPNLESSAVAFLQKPFSPTELCGKIRELLDGRRPETPQSELAPSTERPTA